MKVWRLSFEVDAYDNLEPVNEWSLEKWRSFDGRPQKKTWRKDKVKREGRRKKLGDAPGYEIPAFSRRAVNCLQSLIKDFVEFLPLDCEEGEFVGINITNVLKNSLDCEKSEMDRFDENRIIMIDKYVFKEDVVRNNPIFLIEGYTAFRFVTDEFVEIVNDNQLEGFCFELVWDSEKLEVINPYQKRYEERVDNLTAVQQQMLENYRDVFFPFFKMIKEDRNPVIQEGTIFAVQFGDQFCFGKVMCMHSYIPCIAEDDFVVCFTDQLSHSLDEYPKEISMNHLLLGPLFVRKAFWKAGIFYTVDCIPLTEKEEELDIGFYDNGNDEIIKRYNIRGEVLSYDPQILTPCIGSMLEDIEKELITELMRKGLFSTEIVPMELDDITYNKICQLVEKGDSYFARDDYVKAVKKYKEALKLVPDPKTVWEASTYIYVAIGEVYYYLSKIEIAIQCYEYAMLCPDGVANPLIHLRLGQCFYEENKFEKSKEHLFRAYMLEGEEIFADEEEKYYRLIKMEIESVKPTDSMEYDRFDDNSDGPVSGLEQEVEAAVDALIEESNRYYDQQDFHSTREYLVKAWYAMPEDNRYTNNYCYMIADALMSVSLELKDIDSAMKWAEEFKLCELDRIEDGDREMQLGIVYYEGKRYEIAKEYFEIANRNSGGRCFWSEDRKYKDFYKNTLK